MIVLTIKRGDNMVDNYIERICYTKTNAEIAREKLPACMSNQHSRQVKCENDNCMCKDNCSFY